MKPHLTIGMACHDDFEGVWWTIQTLRAYRPELMKQIELVVVDNNPVSEHAKTLQSFFGQWLVGNTADKSRNPLLGALQYVPFTEATGTSAPRDKVFRVATADLVMCIDSHVLLLPGSVEALLDYVAAHPTTLDLLSGPMVYDDLQQVSTHFANVWGSDGMWGRWGVAWLTPTGQMVEIRNKREIDNAATDDRAIPFDLMTGEALPHLLPATGYSGHEKVLQSMGWTPAVAKGEPFEVGAMGLGLFACRKDAWLGFNPAFRGFGGEEWYIHTKFRQAGRKCLCLPGLKWLHRFGRPGGVTYPLTVWHKARNYVIGHRELGLPLGPVYEHFVKTGKLSQEHWDAILAGDVEPPAPPKPPGCNTCGGQVAVYPASIDEWYSRAAATPSDINEHCPTLKELASQCEHVTEFGVRRGVSTVALLAGKPKRMVSYDLTPSAEAPALKLLAEKNGTQFEFRQGDSRSAAVEETDLLFIDTVHTAAHVLAELKNAAPKCRRYLVFHDTEPPWGYYDEGGGNGGGVRGAILQFLKENPEWTAVRHHPNNHGLTVLSRDDRDKQQPPGTLRKALNFAKALAAHAAAGQKIVSDEVHAARLELCVVCPNRFNDVCGLCGCPVATKASWAEQSCPADPPKWGPVE